MEASFLEKGGLSDTAMKQIEQLAQDFTEGGINEKITTTQLRKFFGSVRKIQADFENLHYEIIMLKPALAYTVGRADKNSKLKKFYDEIRPLIDAVVKAENNEVKQQRFNNFVSILEAIVAYHKYYETLHSGSSSSNKGSGNTDKGIQKNNHSYNNAYKK